MDLGFVHILDIGPICFQIIEQKLVQRSETHTEAQSDFRRVVIKFFFVFFVNKLHENQSIPLLQ